MIVMGLTMGMAIISYNYGAQKQDRVKPYAPPGIIVGVLITNGGFIICELFSAHTVSAIFTDSEELINVATGCINLYLDVPSGWCWVCF